MNAIVVPGSGMIGRDGVYRITQNALRLVRDAERLVEEGAAELVVFSGWSPTGGPSEAEQMHAAWNGADIELVVEPTATVTAQNASRTLPLLLERGVTRAIVVATPLHVRRARYFFSRLYGAAGIETEFRTARVRPTLHALTWELVALSVRRAQLRAARSELE